MTLWAIEGSSVPLPGTDDLKKAFGEELAMNKENR